MNLWITRVWAGEVPVAQWLLWPLSLLFRLVLFIRKLAVLLGLLAKPISVGKPVVVIGNVTVGGSGKTPLTIWLVEWFSRQGLRVGVLSRGFGGSSLKPSWVEMTDDPRKVGDEPLLIKQRTQVPVMVSRDRVAGARLLAPLVDVIVCDDGLQHRRLARDLEWLVIDGRRRFGNGLLLPAGPCREPISACLKRVSARICNGGEPQPGELAMRLVPVALVRLKDAKEFPVSALKGQTVDAMAGIGDPKRFFLTLESIGLTVHEHPLADHSPWPEFMSRAQGVWVMTEKDAMKCPTEQKHAYGDNWYYLKVNAELSESATKVLAHQCWDLWRPGGSGG